MVEDIIDNRLKLCINLHDVLHELCMGRRTRTSILDLIQELASINQESLFLVLLDLHKAYDTLDWGCLLTTLEGYDAGPYMCGILDKFWERQEATTYQNGYHGTQLKATRATTQGDLI